MRPDSPSRLQSRRATSRLIRFAAGAITKKQRPANRWMDRAP